MESICRTCLRTNTTQFNIFEHFQSNKFVSDLIMDCVPIKILKGDGFPANICKICLDKLTSVYDFKEMVIQSNMKLQKFHSNKTEEGCQNNTNNTFLKEELRFIKNEKFDSLIDLNTSPKYVATAQTNLSENKSTISNSPTEINPTLLQSKSYDEKFLSSDNNHESNILTMDFDLSVKEEKGNSTKEKVPDNSNKFSTVLEQYNHYPDHSSCDDENEMETEREGSEGVTSTILKQKKKERAKYNNETQLQLLDNSEYLKIKQMGLSKKEKDRATILCKECNRTFNFRYYVAVHIHMHTGNLPFKCDQCDLKFPKENRLNHHRRVHFQTKEVACEECGMSFFNIHHLKSHKAKHSDERPHKCSICEKTFKFSAALKKHQLIHKRDKNFMCEVCGKTFTESAGLTHHKITHSNQEKSFICKICGKSFARKKALSRHVKRHTNEKPFVCNYCGKPFRDNGVLQNHILIHTDSKPFACEVCGKKFRQRSCIPRHMRIHTGETPYPCELCSTSFKYSHHLRNHMKVHKQEVCD